jgi:hypothetical protein
MDHNLDQLKEYLVSLGTDTVAHSGSAFMAHLTGVYDYLKSWNCPEQVMVAGLFHSIYGTEAFNCFALALTRREELRQQIGQAAERLVYIFSAASWPSFQASVMTGNIRHLRDRFTNETLVITRDEFENLLWVHLANALEQESRVNERRPRGYADRARLWSIVSGKLGEKATASWDEIYSGESAVSKSAWTNAENQPHSAAIQPPGVPTSD